MVKEEISAAQLMCKAADCLEKQAAQPYTPAPRRSSTPTPSTYAGTPQESPFWSGVKGFGSGLWQGVSNVGRGAAGLAETGAGSIGTGLAAAAAPIEYATDRMGITNPATNASWDTAKQMGRFTGAGAKNVGDVFGAGGEKGLMGRGPNHVTKMQQEVMDAGNMGNFAQGASRVGLGFGQVAASAAVPGLPAAAAGGLRGAATAAGGLQRARQVGTGAMNVARNLPSNAARGARYLPQAARYTANTARNIAGNTANVVRNTVSRIPRNIPQAANTARNIAGNTANVVRNTVSRIPRNIPQAANTARNTARRIPRNIPQAANTARNTAGNTANVARNTARNIAGNTANVARNTARRIPQAARNTARRIPQAARNTARGARSTGKEVVTGTRAAVRDEAAKRTGSMGRQVPEAIGKKMVSNDIKNRAPLPTTSNSVYGSGRTRSAAGRMAKGAAQMMFPEQRKDMIAVNFGRKAAGLLEKQAIQPYTPPARSTPAAPLTLAQKTRQAFPASSPAWAGVKGFFGGLPDSVLGGLEGDANIVSNAATGLVGAGSTALSAIPAGAEAVSDAITGDKFNTSAQTMKNLAEQTWGAVKGVGAGVVNVATPHLAKTDYRKEVADRMQDEGNASDLTRTIVNAARTTGDVASNLAVGPVAGGATATGTAAGARALGHAARLRPAAALNSLRTGATSATNTVRATVPTFRAAGTGAKAGYTGVVKPGLRALRDAAQGNFPLRYPSGRNLLKRLWDPVNKGRKAYAGNVAASNARAAGGNVFQRLGNFGYRPLMRSPGPGLRGALPQAARFELGGEGIRYGVGKLTDAVNPSRRGGVYNRPFEGDAQIVGNAATKTPLTLAQKTRQESPTWAGVKGLGSSLRRDLDGGSFSPLPFDQLTNTPVHQRPVIGAESTNWSGGTRGGRRVRTAGETYAKTVTDATNVGMNPETAIGFGFDQAMTQYMTLPDTPGEVDTVRTPGTFGLARLLGGKAIADAAGYKDVPSVSPGSIPAAQDFKENVLEPHLDKLVSNEWLLANDENTQSWANEPIFAQLPEASQQQTFQRWAANKKQEMRRAVFQAIGNKSPEQGRALESVYGDPGVKSPLENSVSPPIDNRTAQTQSLRNR